MNQHEFYFDEPLSKIAKRFQVYHAENPDVYDALASLARKFRSNSNNAQRKIGIKMLYEVLRWNYYISVETTEEYKLCNDFTACYARLLMRQEADLKNAFQIKKSEVD